MASFKEVKVLIFVFCFLFPNLAIMGQLRPMLRRSTGAINAPPSVNFVRPQSYPEGLGLQNLEHGLEELLSKSVKIKSPSYQHKLLQLHGESNPDSMHGYNPRKLLLSHYLLSKLMPSYPVAAKVVKIDARESGGRNVPNNLDNEDADFVEALGAAMEPQVFLNLKGPNYNPFVGTQALTNITKFFHHVRENLRAVHSREHQDDADMGSEEVIG